MLRLLVSLPLLLHLSFAAERPVPLVRLKLLLSEEVRLLANHEVEIVNRLGEHICETAKKLFADQLRVQLVQVPLSEKYVAGGGE